MLRYVWSVTEENTVVADNAGSSRHDMVWAKLRQAVMAVATFMNIYNDNVCFHSYNIGCFDNKVPFDNTGGILPQSPDKLGVKFLLYNREFRFVPETITRDAITLTRSSFDRSKDTKFIIHGYRDDGYQEWVAEMKDALLDRKDVNVIVVHWEAGADTIDYNQAAANTRAVGALLAQLMTSLNETSGAQLAAMHIIGHSLGAHIAGYAGHRVRGVGRITGLDPAGPSFEGRLPMVRLDLTDADYVDVIHTDAEPLTSLGFGIRQSVGDVDFFVNGGTDQPGCKSAGRHIFKLITGKFKDFARGVGCSHARARRYFIESINSKCIFKSYPCASMEKWKAGKCACNGRCARMGYESHIESPRGSYYLTTNSAAPFCQSMNPR